MYYELVEWHHSFAEEPVVIIYELDSSRWETRKMELFADGTIGAAGAPSDQEPPDHAARPSSSDSTAGPASGTPAATSSTLLAEKQTPPLAEINSSPEFSGTEISRAHFEAMWRLAHSSQAPGTA